MSGLLSVILPCYNEAENIPLLFKRFAESLGTRSDVEVIMIDNGSTDNSSVMFNKEIEKPEHRFARVVRIEKNLGYGFGIMSGVREARGDVIAWTHADLQTDPKDALLAYGQFVCAPDVTRTFLKGRRIHRNLMDALFTFGMSLVSSWALGEWLSDINAQPKMFHRSFLDHMQNPPADFSLDLYVLYLAKKNGLTILEQSVSFAERKHGISKGGGTVRGKLKLIKRTWSYILRLRREINHGLR